MTETEWEEKLAEVQKHSEHWYGMYKKLEAENAELKSVADFQTSSNMDRYFQLKRSKEKLTKAKELIEDMYYRIPASYSDYFKDVMERAKQFLKEE